MATYAPNGAPVIIYNPNVLTWVTPATRVFFYAHECAHHVLGHGVRGHPLLREQEADCWAVQQLTGRGIFGDQEINAVQWDLSRFARGDWSHLPGPIRAINLRACIANGGRDNDTGSSEVGGDACYDRCQAIENRCTARCDENGSGDSCSDRCTSRFDRCTSRCN